MKNSSDHEQKFQSASFGRLLLDLCLPTVIVMLVLVIYNMADIFFIGRTGDPNQVAGVSLASPLFSILSGLGVLLGTGGSTASSLALGRGDRDSIRKISAFCFYSALAIGVLFGAALLIAADPIVRLLGSNDATHAYTLDYCRIFAIGAPVILFTNVFGALIRADGSAKNGMIANLAGTVTNIVLDPVLILGLGWGVTGAAIATVLGNIVSAMVLIRFLRTKEELYSLKAADFSFNKEILLLVLPLGAPMASSTILMSISHTIANNLMIQYGASAISAQSVAGKINMIITMTAMGICMGMQPVISFTYGAKDIRRMWMILKKTALTAIGAGTVLSGLCLLFRDRLLTAFLDNEEVLKIGQTCMLATVSMGPFYGIYQTCTSFLQSTGKAKYAIIVALLEKGLIYLPVLFILHRIWGMYGIIFTGAVTILLSVVAALLLSLYARKKDPLLDIYSE